MTSHRFSLQPFPVHEPPDLTIIGSIARDANRLAIHYHLSGRDLATVSMPTLSDSPDRQHNLWENTCFEFFLGISGRDRYWEFNLSPSGNWNIYRFDHYRSGMQEEPAFTALPFSVQSYPNEFAIALTLNSDAIALAEHRLDAAITTVIKTTNGRLTYWALVHPGQEADFHRRDSFVITL